MVLVLVSTRTRRPIGLLRAVIRRVLFVKKKLGAQALTVQKNFASLPLIITAPSASFPSRVSISLNALIISCAKATFNLFSGSFRMVIT